MKRVAKQELKIHDFELTVNVNHSETQEVIYD